VTVVKKEVKQELKYSAVLFFSSEEEEKLDK
jgi:hypothetical protein